MYVGVGMLIYWCGGRKQVNISSALYDDGLLNFFNAPATLFIPMQQEIYQLIRRDTLPRFLLSEEYRAYIQNNLPSHTSGLASPESSSHSRINC